VIKDEGAMFTLEPEVAGHPGSQSELAIHIASSWPALSQSEASLHLMLGLASQDGDV